MAQLRDAQTSELIAEGTPEEIAFAAEAFAADEVLFDDVGGVARDGRALFDPVAVRKQHTEATANAEQILADIPAKAPADVDADEHKARRDGLRQAVKERRARAETGKALQTAARAAMDAAHERVGRHGG